MKVKEQSEKIKLMLNIKFKPMTTGTTISLRTYSEVIGSLCLLGSTLNNKEPADKQYTLELDKIPIKPLEMSQHASNPTKIKNIQAPCGSKSWKFKKTVQKLLTLLNFGVGEDS